MNIDSFLTRDSATGAVITTAQAILQAALRPARTDEADDIMYRAGREARRDGAPEPGEYCREGDAYRCGWYDEDEESQP